MLVVTRKVGERIVIGDKVVVTVVRISGNIVRVGVEAPADCPVVRRELVDKGPPRANQPAIDATAGRARPQE
ncbi:MAG: carbon storage regulator [Pirellulales bacterium]